MTTLSRTPNRYVGVSTNGMNGVYSIVRNEPRQNEKNVTIRHDHSLKLENVALDTLILGSF